MAQWYYAHEGTRVGPVEDEYFEELVKQGTVTPDTLVWRSGMGDWQAYRLARFAAYEEVPPAPAQAAPQQQQVSHPVHPAEPAVQAVPNEAPRRVETVAAEKPAMRYAGFWVRVMAALIDWVILIPITMVATAMQGVLAVAGAGNGEVFTMLLTLVLVVAYEVWFTVAKGATLGKMAMGLRVVTAEGGSIPYPLALGRCFAKWISSIVLCIGYLIVGLDAEKRGLHDHLCSTRVVRTR